eukprot:g6684.t1
MLRPSHGHLFRRVHSQKPFLDAFLPEGPKLEIFARNLRPHWCSWGLLDAGRGVHQAVRRLIVDGVDRGTRMVNWNQLQNATTPDSKPTPGWLFNEIIRDVRNNPKDGAEKTSELATARAQHGRANKPGEMCGRKSASKTASSCEASSINDDTPDVAEYLMQCVCNDQLNIQLKGVLCIKHIAAEERARWSDGSRRIKVRWWKGDAGRNDVTFQNYLLSCPGALKIMDDIAAPPIVPQARAIEPQEWPELDTTNTRTGRSEENVACPLQEAIRTPHSVEKSTAGASLKARCQGFGNFEPPPEEGRTGELQKVDLMQRKLARMILGLPKRSPIPSVLLTGWEEPTKKAGVAGQAAEFVADSIGDMVDDFKEKGAVGALKDATIDALDLVLDGVDTIWGWVAGSKETDQPRICQPVSQPQGPGQFPGAQPGTTELLAWPRKQPYTLYLEDGETHAGACNLRTGGYSSASGAPFQPPVQAPKTSANHYAAAFGGGVVGANNPVMVSGLPNGQPAPNFQSYAGAAAAASATSAASAAAAASTPAEPAAEAPKTPMVDLLSMEEPAAKSPGGGGVDLLGDL